MEKDLRYLVKLAKIKYGCSYRVFAEYLGMNTSSFYNYLNGQYDLSAERQEALRDFIEDLE